MRSKSGYLQSPWRTFLFAITPVRGLFWLMWFMLVIGNIVGGLLPYYFKVIVDQVTSSSGPVILEKFTGSFTWIVVVLVIPEICFRSAHIMETYVVTGAFQNITTELYQGLIKRPTSYFENRFSGELGRRIEQVATGVTYFVESFPWQLGWILFSFVMTGVLLALTHIWVLTVFGVWFVFFIVTSVPLLRLHYRASQTVAASHASLTGGVIDSLANISLIHSFGAVGYEQSLHGATVSTVVGVERDARWLLVVNKFHQGLSIIALALSLTWVSLVLFSRNEFSVGSFVVVAATIPGLIGVIWSMGDVALQASRHFGELSDAVAHLRDQEELLVGGTVNRLERAGYSVEFADVLFTYPGVEKPVFNDFSLSIQQGEHVGIVGTSGAGKSTLVKLLLRQYEVQSGMVSVGGVSMKEFTLEAFNKLVSYVPQDTSLFHRTLFDNIQYANHTATNEQVLEASKKAHAHEFIIEAPQGYETKVGERGVKLSGGQRQRIALARAILKDAPILVLDEATSALDTESETAIQEALHELFQNRTVIAIAHRLSTLRAMDRIIVMEGGTIVESGSPQELLQRESSIFKDMWERQKNGFV